MWFVNKTRLSGPVERGGLGPLELIIVCHESRRFLEVTAEENLSLPLRNVHVSAETFSEGRKQNGFNGFNGSVELFRDNIT